MAKNKQVLYVSLIAVMLLLVLIYYQTLDDADVPQPSQRVDTAEVQVSAPGQEEPSVNVPEPAQDQVDAQADVVNEQFADEPRIQKAWVSRGQGVVLKNYPDADSADFRESFFYRGFKDRAVTCGEVRFQADGMIVDDYQRFIYVGGQLSHLENDVQNFHILWDKLCMQTYDRN